MIMKTASLLITVFAALCVTSLTSRAQDQAPVGTERPNVITAPNAIYVEILGSGLIPTINYDRMLTNSFAGRIGLGYLPLGSVINDNGNSISASITTIPATLSWFPFGATSSKLEIGAGIVYASIVAKSFNNAAEGSALGYTGILGYRLEPLDGGFMLRLAITPWDIGSHFQMWGGVSLGVAF
jgi:hypothetical protein